MEKTMVSGDISQTDAVSIGMILRAMLKALVLFALFNAGYFALQPIRSSHIPTLYNTFVSGLTRLTAGNEYSIRRLLADHAVQQARTDHFNIVILGSSEIWGVTSTPDQTIPASLDRLGLVAADGRSVSIYNLSYPGPDILKDLLIWESLRQAHLPLNLVILTVNNGAFSRDIEHQMLTENGEQVQDLLSRYGLDPSLLLGAARSSQTTFWQDRPDLAGWLKTQTRAPAWVVMHQDRASTPLPEPAQTEFLRRAAITPITRPDVLAAFAHSTREAKTPLLVMAVPLASVNDPFVDWIIGETETLSLPLLDCSAVITEPSSFEGSVHLMPEIHPHFADILAGSFSQQALSSVSTALPLHRSQSAQTEGLCAVYPAISPR